VLNDGGLLHLHTCAPRLIPMHVSLGQASLMMGSSRGGALNIHQAVRVF
jgi:hypothetical protein